MKSTELNPELAAILSQCGSDGWNGDGEEPITEEACRAAQDFASRLAEAVPGLPEPSFAPEGDGCIELYYHAGGTRNFLSISILAAGGGGWAASIESVTSSGGLRGRLLVEPLLEAARKLGAPPQSRATEGGRK